MFRPFRRQLGRRLPPEQAQAIQRAIQLINAGQPGEAAKIFTQLAGQAEATNHPRIAANLHAQAAHAFTDDKDVSAALDHARQALNLFLQYQMVDRAARFYANLSRKMQNRGLASAADVLKSEYGPRLGPIPAQPAPAPAALRPRLPAACPQCGAPVRSDEVDWMDERSAECTYCGATLQA